MAKPFFRVELRLLPTEKGGRKGPVFDDYRPSWNLGNKWLGEPTINDGRVFLEDSKELSPGAEWLARIEPLASEFWGNIRPGSIWEWRFHFDHHWGDHAIDALRALHRACGQA